MNALAILTLASYVFAFGSYYTSGEPKTAATFPSLVALFGSIALAIGVLA